MLEKFKEWTVNAIMVLAAIMYVLGLGVAISDDRRYDAKDVGVAFVLFPYAIWIGAKETGRYFATTETQRRTENLCLDALEGERIPFSNRTRYCKCFSKSRDNVACREYSDS